MKKVSLILLCLLLTYVPCFASPVVSTFELNALYEIQDGKITKTTGKYTKIYSIENNNICQLSSKNEHYEGFDDSEKTCFKYTYIPTMVNTGYFLVLDKNQKTNAIMQFSADFKSMTLYQFNALDTHCTVWYGKSLY